MNIYIIMMAFIPLIYFGMKGLVRQVGNNLNKKLVYVRQKSDKFNKLEDELVTLQEEYNKQKQKTYKLVNNNYDIISKNIKKIEILEIKDDKGELDSKERKDLEKLKNNNSKLEKENFKLKNDFNNKTKDIHSSISKLKKDMLKNVKVSLDDFTLTEKFLLTRSVRRVIKDARKKSLDGFGAVEVFEPTGSKLYFKKFKKIMNVNGTIRFYNPVNVNKSWTGLPTLYYDDNDPEPKNINNYIYPMGAEEIAAVMFDQNLPKDDATKGGRNWLLRMGALAAIAMVVFYIFMSPEEGAKAAAPAVKEVVNQTIQNASVVIK